jgi:hypothetical protein
LAVKVTVSKPFSLDRFGESTVVTVTAINQHHIAGKQKFVGRNADYQAALQDLVTQNILLVPIMINDLGGLGTLGHHYLFGPDDEKAPNLTIPPPTNPNSNILYLRANGKTAAIDLLKQANKNWQCMHPNRQCGPSYHTS